MLDCAASMTARILDGKSLAAATRTALKQKVDALVQRGVRPGLTVIIAGDNPASKVYVRNKTLAAEETGVRSWLLEFGKEVSETELMQTVAALNADPAVHGILVQLPLPQQIDSQKVLNAVDPAKDVDGFHPVNAGRLATGVPALTPCTPLGCIMLAVMALPVPITAFDYCMTLAGPVGVLLGAAPVFQVSLVVTLILALLGQGGFTVIGLNTLVLGGGAMLARPVYLWSVRALGPARAVALGTVVSKLGW